MCIRDRGIAIEVLIREILKSSFLGFVFDFVNDVSFEKFGAYLLRQLSKLLTGFVKATNKLKYFCSTVRHDETPVFLCCLVLFAG